MTCGYCAGVPSTSRPTWPPARRRPGGGRGQLPGAEPYGGPGHPAFELFIAPGPIPVGTEMYRLTPAGEEFIGWHDGQAWLGPGAGG